MDLTTELKNVLYQSGAALVGIGSLDVTAGQNYPIGISVAIPLEKDLVRELKTAPSKRYYDAYHEMNEQRNSIVTTGEALLRDCGYAAYAQTTDRVEVNEQYVSKLPHKTVATRAGLGWIGKNDLLITKKYGSAIRLSSLLTNAALICDKPVEKSKCGSCRLCVDNCPAQAIKGNLWQIGVSRESLVDVKSCYKKQCEIMRVNTGLDVDLCGKCFAVCAYTQRYIKQN